jgi:hypothetical protein
MRPIDPTPFVDVYFVLVFLLPWLVCASFVARKLMYARSRGISLLSPMAFAQIRTLRQTDSYAAQLHRRSLQWLAVTAAMWFVGFALLGLTLHLLQRRGII